MAPPLEGERAERGWGPKKEVLGTTKEVLGFLIDLLGITRDSPRLSRDFLGSPRISWDLAVNALGFGLMLVPCWVDFGSILIRFGSIRALVALEDLLGPPGTS